MRRVRPVSYTHLGARSLFCFLKRLRLMVRSFSQAFGGGGAKQDSPPQKAGSAAQPIEDMMPISGSITDSRIKPTSTEKTATSVGSTSETRRVTSASTSS